MRTKTVSLSFCLAALVCVPAMAKSNALSGADREFLKTAAVFEMTEAHLGQTAQDHAEGTAVKDFGQKLVQDGTAGYQELTALAQKEGETIPKGIDIKKDRAAERVIALKGKQFDRQFLQHEIQNQRKTMAEFQREAEHGSNADLKAYASKRLAAVEDHLRRAEQLEKSEKHG